MLAPILPLAHHPLEIERKRAVLFSTRLQYGPETQPIREQAIDRLIAHELLIEDGQAGVNLARLHDLSVRAGVRISRGDIQRCLERLTQAGELEQIEFVKPNAFRLSPKRASELWDLQHASETRIQGVLQKLFKGAPRGWKSYEEPFIWCIAKVFSELGEMYARQLSGSSSKDALLNSPNLLAAITEARAKFRGTDHATLREGVFRFFREEDTDASVLKWNLAQNYYVAKTLGLDPTGSLLSAEVLGGAELYMDTNVLVTALAPQEDHHESFLELSHACKELKIQLRYCQISVDELRHVAAVQEQMIQKIEGKISGESASTITSVFFEVYKNARDAGNAASAFQRFIHPVKVLITMRLIGLTIPGL